MNRHAPVVHAVKPWCLLTVIGQVVGSAMISDGTRHAFLWTGSGPMLDLGTLDGTGSGATGINNKGNMMHAPEFKPLVPYTYPLYKVHKLNAEEIKNKAVPPVRLVHATRDGPLYRLEKYVGPTLTTISRKYCEQEFILDTPDIISQIEMYTIYDLRFKNILKSLLYNHKHSPSSKVVVEDSTVWELK